MLRKLMKLATDNSFRVQNLFTFRKNKRNIQEVEAKATTTHEEEGENTEKGPRRIVKVPKRKLGFARLPLLRSAPAAGVANLHQIDEMVARCQPQRQQMIDILWMTCYYLFPNSVFDRYSIFSLAVYLFDAFTLHQFQSLKDKPSLCRFSNAALFNTSCSLAPPCLFCCLMLAAKIDCNYVIRLYRKFDLNDRVTYYFNCDKYVQSNCQFSNLYCIFESDNKEGKMFRFRNGLEINQDSCPDAEVPRELNFRKMDADSMLLYNKYLQNFELFMLKEVLPFFDHQKEMKPDWIFPNPCAFNQALSGFQQRHPEVCLDHAQDISDEERQKQHLVFLQIGEQTRQSHLQEFSFGSKYFESKKLHS